MRKERKVFCPTMGVNGSKSDIWVKCPLQWTVSFPVYTTHWFTTSGADGDTRRENPLISMSVMVTRALKGLNSFISVTSDESPLVFCVFGPHEFLPSVSLFLWYPLILNKFLNASVVFILTCYLDFCWNWAEEVAIKEKQKKWINHHTFSFYWVWVFLLLISSLICWHW